MTILITGGAGFIGGHTVLAFLDRGEIPIVLDDLSTGNGAAVLSGVPFLAGDVGDTELVLGLVQTIRADGLSSAVAHDGEFVQLELSARRQPQSPPHPDTERRARRVSPRIK